MRLTIGTAAVAVAMWSAGCGGRLDPVAVDTRHDQCDTCRMVVSSTHTASEVLAPYQDVKFFDDLGCLDKYLAGATLPAGARVLVADHRTGDWVDAEYAVFTRVGEGGGAMGSPFVAYASVASRDADRELGGVTVPLATALPSFHRTGGSR